MYNETQGLVEVRFGTISTQLVPSGFFLFVTSFFFFIRLYPQHLGVPRPGIEPKPQQQQHQILNPLYHKRTPVASSLSSESFFFFFFFFVFCPFRAVPEAYGGSHVRSLIRDVAAGLLHNHSNVRSELCL